MEIKKNGLFNVKKTGRSRQLIGSEKFGYMYRSYFCRLDEWRKRANITPIDFRNMELSQRKKIVSDSPTTVGERLLGFFMNETSSALDYQAVGDILISIGQETCGRFFASGSKVVGPNLPQIMKATNDQEWFAALFLHPDVDLKWLVQGVDPSNKNKITPKELSQIFDQNVINVDFIVRNIISKIREMHQSFGANYLDQVLQNMSDKTKAREITVALRGA